MQLEIEHLSLKYQRKTCAVNDVSFCCTDSHILGIAGPSGAGKSTLGRCIAGLQKPDNGRILADGLPLSTSCRRSAMTYRQTVQFVFQDPLASLPPHLSLSVPLMDAAAVRYSTKAEMRCAVDELLAELKLDWNVLSRRPGEISGGQRQRAALARALVAGPRFLVLDEAVSALDLINQQRIMKLLLEYREHHGLGIIFISHNLNFLMNFCTRIFIYSQGGIVEDSTPENLLSGKAEHVLTQELVNTLPKVEIF